MKFAASVFYYKQEISCVFTAAILKYYGLQNISTGTLQFGFMTWHLSMMPWQNNLKIFFYKIIPGIDKLSGKSEELCMKKCQLSNSSMN
jgi:hypothetical protein